MRFDSHNPHDRDHALDIAAGARSNPRAAFLGGEVKLSMKRFVSALMIAIGVGWLSVGSAQAQTTLACSTFAGFTCAFSAAETFALITPKTNPNPNLAGQPDVYVGYLSFDPTGANVTLTGTSDIDGVVTKNFTDSGTCTSAPSANQPATLTFAGTEISFVADSSDTELQFIVSSDNPNAAKAPAFRVRAGVCRKQ
jgi:hypothetical protein